MNSPTENKEFLFGDILPQKYKMEAEDVLPYYVYKQILATCLKTGTLQRHYRLNNDFVRKYISGEGEGAAQESAWCSPSAFREEGTLLIGSMSLPECESAGTVSVVLLDSTEKQSYYISDAELMYAMSLIGDDLMKDCAVIETVYSLEGRVGISFSFFYTKDHDLLDKVRKAEGFAKFCDCNAALSFRSVSASRYEAFTQQGYAEKFFRNKSVLIAFVRTLAEYVHPTKGLKTLDKRAVRLFEELYGGDLPSTLSERKLFFREMSSSAGPLSYTQGGSNFLLTKLKELCEMLGIRYWLYYGSLLGAKRHAGFIPWDDDIDIGLMRSDLERLRSFLKNDKYFSVDVLYNTEWADRVYKFRFRGDYLPVYVDLFPFDYCSGEAEKIWDNLKKIKGEMVRKFREEEQKSGCAYRRSFEVPAEHLAVINGFFDEFGQKAKKMLGITEGKADKIVYGYDNVFLSDWLQVFSVSETMPLEKALFNGVEYPVFKNGDEVLQKNYRAPYTLPDDIVSHRHTERMSAESIAKLNLLTEQLKEYKF